MTATEASRNFAALLDEVAGGETVVVTRGGRRVASIGPVAAGNGEAVMALLSAGCTDAHFADDVAAVRESASWGGPAWPDD